MQYQRAVTPTIDNNSVGGVQGSTSGSSSNSIRGKVISYSNGSGVVNNHGLSHGNANNGIASLSSVPRSRLNNNMTFSNNSPNSNVGPSGYSLLRGNSISSAGGSLIGGGIASSSSRLSQATSDTSMNITGRSTSASLANNNPSTNTFSSLTSKVDSASSIVPRNDLIPLSDEVPSDGIIFARSRHNSEILVIFRTPEERLRNPERLNLDRRQLVNCPILEQEQRLRLLNFQNNSITAITNLENLPNLIFLDFYNNKLASLSGPLSSVRGLRVLMAGKNRISRISNLSHLRKLDVLDLHSNDISIVEGLDGLGDLRVLNLAGNHISLVDSLSSLTSLTELNLRRNCIQSVSGLERLPALQRVFLSHNKLSSLLDVACIFQVPHLIELSMDGNPVCDQDPQLYRTQLIARIRGLKHLDLKRVTEEERDAALRAHAHYSMAETAKNVKQQGNQITAENIPSQHKKGGFTNEDTSAAALTLQVAQSTSSNNSTATSVASSPHENGRFSSNEDIQSLADLLQEQPEKQASYIDDEPNNIKSSKKDSGGAGSLASTTQNTPTKTSQIAQAPLGFAMQARLGRVSKTQSLLDVEVSGDDKILICVGESWEWNLPKRLLPGLTEAIIVHMPKETIINKFSPSQISQFSQLRSLRLLHNEFSSLKQLDFISRLFGAPRERESGVNSTSASLISSPFSGIEHLWIQENPIIRLSPELVRGYLIASMPKLQSFNDGIISQSERKECEKKFAAFFFLREKAVKGTATNNNTQPAQSVSISNTNSRPTKLSHAYISSLNAQNLSALPIASLLSKKSLGKEEVPKGPGNRTQDTANQESNYLSIFQEMRPGKQVSRSEFDGLLENELRKIICATLKELR